jgi:GTP-binding protein Era
MKTGFVAIAGRPNAGKSTLLNALMHRKLAIVSEKPETTRSQIRGIYTGEDCQIIFTDTPGIHKPKFLLDSRMMKETGSVISGVDLIYLVVDGTQPFAKGDAFQLDMVRNAGLPVFLILNKTDRMSREKVLNTLTSWQNQFTFQEFFAVSAKTQTDFSDLVRTTAEYLPEGPALYPSDQITDEPQEFLIAETIREKILECTEKEVPHAVAVQVESVKEEKKGTEVRALILVERDGQKGILIGKDGAMLKKIGTRARTEIEQILGRHVYLDLFVRVQPDWRMSAARIAEYGYGGSDEKDE